MFKSLHKAWYWHKLKRVVAACCEAAKGHEANGVLPGNEMYYILYLEVANSMQEYKKYSTSCNELIMAKIPNIKVLKDLSKRASSSKPGFIVTVLSIIAATEGAALLAGFIAASYMIMYHLWIHVFIK